MKRKIIIIIILIIIFIAILSNFISKDLNGQTIAFIGDSLMAGYGNDDKGFDYYLASYLPDSKFINNSRSGSTITDNTGNDEIVIINQVETLQGTPDIIVFDGGANDILGYAMEYLQEGLKKEIGKVEEDPNKMSDPNTVIGDFEEIVVALQTKYPNAKLCYAQLFLVDDETIDEVTINESIKPEIKTRSDVLFSQIKLLCEKRNVEYIDVSDKFIGTGLTYRQDDWIHIKEDGYKILAPYLLEKLEKVL